MRARIKDMALRLLTRPGSRSFFRPWVWGRVPIIMMHRFERAGGRPDRTTTRFLERCAAFLRNERYAALTLGQLCAMLREGRWPERAVCLTVDDGYGDFARLAAPVLRAFDLTCTVFLITGLIDGRVWSWWDRIEYALESAGARADRPGFRSWLAGCLGSPPPDGGPGVVARAVEACKKMDDEERSAFIRQLESRLEVDLPATPPDAYRGMTWDDVRRLAAEGIEFGAHTVTHPILSRLPQARAEREVVESLEAVERNAGLKATTFAYPNGTEADFTPAVMDLLAARGVLGAVTTVDGILDRSWLRAVDRPFYRLPRVGLPSSMPRFVQCVSGLEALKQKLRAVGTRWRGRIAWSR